VKHVNLIAALAVAAAACSGGSQKPGAVLHGPGALAIFDGIVAHGSGTLRPYVAVANQRGDELRLIDQTDNQVVESPGLIFPLSVPGSGRPLWIASVDLGDGALVGGVRNTHDRADALVVIAAGGQQVDLIDTWSGQPTVVASVPLGDTAVVLSMAGMPVPGVAGKGRILVGLAGAKLVVIDLERDASEGALPDAIKVPMSGGVPAPSAVLSLADATVTPNFSFDVVSIAPGATPGADYVWAASPDPLPNGVLGVAKIVVPAALGGWLAKDNVTALDAKVPTEAVAAILFDTWSFPVSDAAPVDDTTTPATHGVERIIALPAAGSCGAPPKAFQCGLLALDTVTGGLVPDPLDGGVTILPISIPAPVNGLVAVGRTADKLVPIVSGAPKGHTTGLAVVTATDGGTYLVDLLRWRIASETSPVSGKGKTRVSVATTVAGTGTPPSKSALGLWPLYGADAADISAVAADLPQRVRVTPGFTPDDDWTLTWQGALPGLETRGATLDAGAQTLSVQYVTDLAATGVGVAPGDLVDIGPIAGFCTGTTKVAVSGIAGAQVTLVPIAPAAWSNLCLKNVPAGTGVVATFRASGLILVGTKSGLTKRLSRRDTPPSAPLPADLKKVPVGEEQLDGERRFYVTDSCDADCQDTWQKKAYSLAIPLPTGPALGLAVGFVDQDCVLSPPGVTTCATSTSPDPGTAIRFTTKSGLTPSRRHPIVSGTSADSDLPSGLAILDPGGSGSGVAVYVSYTAGMVMNFSTASATGSMSVIR
jgi:hypothetical protein